MHQNIHLSKNFQSDISNENVSLECKNHEKRGNALTMKEIEEAENLLFKGVQVEEFWQ